MKILELMEALNQYSSFYDMEVGIIGERGRIYPIAFVAPTTDGEMLVLRIGEREPDTDDVDTKEHFREAHS